MGTALPVMLVDKDEGNIGRIWNQPGTASGGRCYGAHPAAPAGRCAGNMKGEEAVKEILEEYGSMILAAVGGGMLFLLLQRILWGDTALFLALLQFWQNRGL